MLNIALSDILQIVGITLAVPGAILAFIKVRRHFVVVEKSVFRQGQVDRVYSSQTKPLLDLYYMYVIKRLPMKSALRDAKKIASLLIQDKYYPTIIVGIGRGGSIFGSMLSYNLCQVPIFSIDRSYEWKDRRIDKILFDFEIPPRYLNRVLLVSGEVHSGNTMTKFRKYLQDMGAHEIKVCTFYKEVTSTQVIDYNLTVGKGIPFMPWQEKCYFRDSLDANNSYELHLKRSSFLNKANKVIYIMRHGETSLNHADVFIGSGTDEIGLSQKGIEQAKAAGELIKNDIGNLQIMAYVSPQKRCMETTNLVTDSIDAVVVKHKSLRERNYGVWENMRRDDLNNDVEYLKYLQNPMNSCPENAESIQDNLSRILSFWNDNIVADNVYHNYLIVTHKTTGRLLLAYLMNTPYSKFRHITFDNESIVKVTIDGEKITCEYMR